jgi:hypothetical protein
MTGIIGIARMIPNMYKKIDNKLYVKNYPKMAITKVADRPARG